MDLQKELDSIEQELRQEKLEKEVGKIFNEADKQPTALIEEEWKEIKGFTTYKISSFGRLQNKHGRVTKGSKNKGGYLTTSLSDGINSRKVYMHILVAEAFLGYVPEKGNLACDHIDYDKTNNKLSNLQIISHRENLTKDRINKTGYIGVAKVGDVYVSSIIYEGKRWHLGTRKTPEAASLLYIKKRDELTKREKSTRIEDVLTKIDDTFDYAEELDKAVSIGEKLIGDELTFNIFIEIVDSWLYGERITRNGIYNKLSIFSKSIVNNCINFLEDIGLIHDGRMGLEYVQ